MFGCPLGEISFYGALIAFLHHFWIKLKEEKEK